MTDPTTTTASADKIVISHATKVIRRRTVLDDVSLELPRGGIYGFSGINGSGKTMLFRAIADLIHLTSGTIDVFGRRVGRDASFPAGLGLILENVGFWEEYTGLDNLRLLASIRGAIGEREIRTALERVGLNPDDGREYGAYSLGMKQRLAVAQAVMEAPELLVLDEPTNALDVDGIALVCRIIREERERGATVLLACHNEPDLEATRAEREAMGATPAEDAADLLYLTSTAVENPADCAPLVVTATFSGDRKYVYQAFRCAFTVTGVVRDDEAGVAVGDTIDVFENLQISTPDHNPTGKGQQGDERMVTFGYGDCSVPYREGQEYLLFLEEKDYPEGMPDTEPAYRLIWHPYAAVPTDAPDHPERIWVDGTHVIHEGVDANGNPYSWEEDDDEMSFGEAQHYDRLCYDEAARDAYLKGASTIIANTLG